MPRIWLWVTVTGRVEEAIKGLFVFEHHITVEFDSCVIGFRDKIID